MATTTADDDITVAEFGRLEDILFDHLREGQERFDVDELVTVTNLSDAKIYEAMALLTRKNDRVSNVGAGEWTIELPDE